MYKDASVGKRVLAFILDAIIIAAISFLFLQILVGKELMEINKIFDDFANGVIDSEEYLSQIMNAYYSVLPKTTLISLGFAFVYYVVLAFFLNGATLGKKICKIKVIKDGEDKATFGSLVIRELVMKYLVNTFTCGILNLISLIKILVSDDKRAIHDLAGSTRVVADEKEVFDVLDV